MIEFKLNGAIVSTDDAPDTPLLWVVRDTFKLKGSKFGCGAGLCGWSHSRWPEYQQGYFCAFDAGMDRRLLRQW